MSTQITVTVAPTAQMPEIPGGGLWGCSCPRFWGCGTTAVTVSDAELTPLEVILAQRDQMKLVIGDSAAPAPGGWAPAGGPGSRGRTGGWPPIPDDAEDPWFRTVVGQATYRELLADARFTVAVLP